MFAIDPRVCYDKKSLRELLKGTCSADRFLARVQPRCVIRGLFFGQHLLDAMSVAPDYRDLTDSRRGTGKKRGKRARAKRASAAPVVELIKKDEIGG